MCSVLWGIFFYYLQKFYKKLEADFSVVDPHNFAELGQNAFLIQIAF